MAGIEIKFTKVFKIFYKSILVIHFYFSKQLFINNEFVDSSSGETFLTISPSTEEKIADVSLASNEDVDKAVQAARKAFELGSEWRSMDASARGALIYKFAQLIRRDLDYLAVIYIFFSSNSFYFS